MTIPSVFLQMDENPNCDAMDGMVFQPRSVPRVVRQVRCEHEGQALWCDVAAVSEGPEWSGAMATLIDDSGDGACYLVFGDSWGLRFKDASSGQAWSLDDSSQWGGTYLLLPGDGSDLRFE